jgi:hypothetical protein
MCEYEKLALTNLAGRVWGRWENSSTGGYECTNMQLARNSMHILMKRGPEELVAMQKQIQDAAMIHV